MNKPRDKPTKKDKKEMLKLSEQKHLIINNQNNKTMLTQTEKTKFQNEAKKLSKWFKIEVTISIFGHVLIHWVYPPQTNDE